MTHRALQFIARAGYASRGIVYLIIGSFALLSAFGAGGDTTGTKGALLKLLQTSYGTTLLLVTAVGLLCYAVWRAVQSLGDADNHGTGLKGLAVRLGLAISALTHLALAMWAVSAALRLRADSDSSGVVTWLMQQPFGRWLVLGVGAGVVVAGLAHLVKGLRRGYEKWLQADERRMRLIRPIASSGLVARGVVFLIVGGMLMYAGMTVDPSEAGGMREALQWVRGLPFGSVIFLGLALGIFLFGSYSLAEAIYRRVGSP